jgi:rubrerythrin
MSATRREALAGAAAATLALYAPASALADAKAERSKASLIAVLNLEQTALVAYEAIANAGVLAPTLRQFLDQDRQHADQLVAAIQSMGAKPPIPPRRTDIPGLQRATQSRDAALGFAISLELRTIAAYQGAVRDVTDSNVLRTCAGAMGTDAQQLVVLRQLAGKDPVPRAFETGKPA